MPIASKGFKKTNLSKIPAIKNKWVDKTHFYVCPIDKKVLKMRIDRKFNLFN